MIDAIVDTLDKMGIKVYISGNSGNKEVRGRRLNGFLELSLNDVTILFLVILLDKTVPVG